MVNPKLVGAKRRNGKIHDRNSIHGRRNSSEGEYSSQFDESPFHKRGSISPSPMHRITN